MSRASTQPAQDQVIEVRGLRTQFGKAVIHKDLNISVMRGEILALVGGSGSGKTTLLREIIGLQEPAAGDIRILGRPREDWPPRMLSRRVGVLFQRGAMFSSLNVFDNIAVPIREHTQVSRELAAEIAAIKIELVGLDPADGLKYPAELSGGMTKRAALARALALDPELLFLDEPTSGLDPHSAEEFDKLVTRLKESLHLTIMMVTHDLDSLWQAADRVAVLGEKRVLAIGEPHELVDNQHPIVQAFFTGARARRARLSDEQHPRQG